MSESLETKARRPRLFDNADDIREVRIKMPLEMLERLRAVSKKSCLEPAVYIRTLLATHLNKHRSS